MAKPVKSEEKELYDSNIEFEKLSDDSTELMNDKFPRKDRSISRNKNKRKESPDNTAFSVNLLDMRHMLGFLN